MKRLPCLIYRINIMFLKTKWGTYVFNLWYQHNRYNSFCLEGSTVTEFCARANNYKSTNLNFRKEQKLSNQTRNQKCFHENYLQCNHKGTSDWKITIIDHAEMEKSLRQKDLYWYYKLKIYAPFGLGECDAYTTYSRQGSLFIIWM